MSLKKKPQFRRTSKIKDDFIERGVEWAIRKRSSMSENEKNEKEIPQVDVEGTTNVKKKGALKYIKDYAKEYCENSSIQGLNYVVRDGISVFERLWWILVLTVCVSGCVYMIAEIYIKWMESPVLVSLATKDTPIQEIPFPSVTICPEAKIKNTCFNYTNVLHQLKNGEQVSETDQKYFDYMSLLCKESNHNITEEKADTFDEDFFNFLYKCQSIDLKKSFCSWMGNVYKCDYLFKPITTDEGICYSFNMFDMKDIYTPRVVKHAFDQDREFVTWDVDDGYPPVVDPNTREYPRRALLSGAINSLNAVFFTKTDDITYSCRDFVYQGLKVSLHMASRIPRPSEVYFNVGLDKITTAVIIPTLMSTSKSVENTPPEVRNCFFSKERKLHYFKYYSQNNCNMECNTNYTKALCGCVAYYMPRTNDTPICGPKKQHCLHQALSPLHKPQTPLEKAALKEKKACFCVPICVDLSYNVELSSGPFEKLDQLNTGKTWEELEGYQASTVKVFFKNPFFLPTQRSELYGPTDFISNFGGILGLFTGFSLFSIAEILYFLTVRLVENKRKHGHWSGDVQS